MAFALEQSLGFLTNRLGNRFKVELERRFAERGHDITAEQWAVLSCLYNEDGLQQHEIAQRISRDKTNVARILALMERRTLIERRIDPDDQRARKIYLTAYGRSLENDLVASAKAVLVTAQQGFSAEQIENLIDNLNRIYENLK